VRKGGPLRKTLIGRTIRQHRDDFLSIAQSAAWHRVSTTAMTSRRKLRGLTRYGTHCVLSGLTHASDIWPSGHCELMIASSYLASIGVCPLTSKTFLIPQPSPTGPQCRLTSLLLHICNAISPPRNRRVMSAHLVFNTETQLWVSRQCGQ
jgi:hypothetical protein